MVFYGWFIGIPLLDFSNPQDMKGSIITQQIITALQLQQSPAPTPELSQQVSWSLSGCLSAVVPCGYYVYIV